MYDESKWFEEATAHSDVGRLAQVFAWEQTPLGPPSGWPHALRHAVRLCFSTRFPVMLVWGPELTLIYNDGYRDMLGTDKHPSALGASVSKVWADIWDDIGPLFDTVLTTGQATWSQDMPLVMNRSGFDEETYFTFSYSPLRDDEGNIAGVLDIATETTRDVVNQRRLVTIGELHAALPTTFTTLRAFAQPIVDVLVRDADVARTAFYDISAPHPRLLIETGEMAGPAELSVVERALGTRQREVGDGLVVKPLRDPSRRGGVAGVMVLKAATGRPWDDEYARYLTGLATTTGAALRDAVRLRTTLDALRQRAERSEEETAQARELALVLQQAVMTDPPQPDDLEVAVHYQPAALDRDIGGDWYDAFMTPGGATTLVIGDVVGHDLTAAATMGQLRGLVRAIGFDSDHPPARLLERVDAAIDGLALGHQAVATAVVARIEQNEEERARSVRTVRWASAGHLPPILVRADGTVEVLTVRNDLPLGLRPGAVRHDHTVELRADDTLVLYTDGLVERRGHSIRDDIATLAEALHGTQKTTLDDVIDTALSRMLPSDGEDDVAIVALRTGPQGAATTAVLATTTKGAMAAVS
ncbi:SpoIIE family protein phosphatase [Cellulosimicrobium cellulans]|uniref:SpoIIE family protein phosphatase n=1 Tax=Cellulosimicrobium cellulans TaxID=1710 RepID=UPI0036E1FA28